jgi:hypothetical protein
VSIERIQTSIIHIPSCSQKMTDNENPNLNYVNGCHGNKNKTFYILSAFHIMLKSENCLLVTKISILLILLLHGNHSHNLSLKYYLVVSLVISNVKKIISVNTFKRSWNNLQKCICLVFAVKKVFFVPYFCFFSKY